mgnify:CR=1 FL=1
MLRALSRSRREAIRAARSATHLDFRFLDAYAPAKLTVSGLAGQRGTPFAPARPLCKILDRVARRHRAETLPGLAFRPGRERGGSWAEKRNELPSATISLMKPSASFPRLEQCDRTGHIRVVGNRPVRRVVRHQEPAPGQHEVRGGQRRGLREIWSRHHHRRTCCADVEVESAGVPHDHPDRS